MTPAVYREAREALIDEMCCRIVECEAQLLIDETASMIAETKTNMRSNAFGAVILLLFFQLWLFWAQHDIVGAVIIVTSFSLVFLVLLWEFTSGNLAIIRLEKSLVYLRNTSSDGLFACRLMRKASDFTSDKTILAAEFLGIHFSVDEVIVDLIRRCAAQMEKNEMNERAGQWLSVAKCAP